MDYEFDFNINNYDTNELEKFFKLNENYSFNDINDKCSKLISIINESRDYDKLY